VNLSSGKSLIRPQQWAAVAPDPTKTASLAALVSWQPSDKLRLAKGKVFREQQRPTRLAQIHSDQAFPLVKSSRNRYALLLVAASLCAGAIWIALEFRFGLNARPRHIVGALVVAVVFVAAVRLARRAVAGKDSNVLGHAPEMSSLSFPPSSLRK